MKKLHENIYVGGQINADDFSQLAEAGIKVIINNRPDNEEIGQFNHQQAQQLAEQNGMSYHYLPMANGQPLPDNLVSDFKKVIDDNPQNPILTHCRSGLRSSFIWALGQISSGQISVDEAILAAQNADIPLHNFKQVLDSVNNT